MRVLFFIFTVGLVASSSANARSYNHSIRMPSTRAPRSYGGSHAVHGYITKRGTYVAPHRQTNPNSTRLDNWSTKGSINPYTGKAGTKDPLRAEGY